MVDGDTLSWAAVAARVINVHRADASFVETIPGNATMWVAPEPGDYYLVAVVPGSEDDWTTWPQSITVTVQGAIVATPEPVVDGDTLSWAAVAARVINIHRSDASFVETIPGDSTMWVAPEPGNYYLVAVVPGSEDDWTTWPQSITVTISEDDNTDLVSIPRAVPMSGDAPLTVVFTPDAETLVAIERYEWDFDGDGRIDSADTVGRNFSFTYRESGTYIVSLKVIDALGAENTATLTIEVGNNLPVVSVEASPSNGSIPLTVNFSAVAADGNGITEFRWDFDGDGDIDQSTDRGSVQFVYSDVGTFQPTVSVVDTLGGTTLLNVPSIEVRAAPVGSLSIQAGASPTSGVVPLAVGFNATVSDPNLAINATWEWDFEGDGVFDSSSQSAPANYTYEANGQYFARLRLTTTDGLTAEDVVEIVVAPDISLSVSQDTIDLELGETTSLDTDLGGTMTLSIVIENAGGSLVKTLVQETIREAGSYSDEWDGTDENGDIVAQGQYRAIVIYNDNGSAIRLDVGLTIKRIETPPAVSFTATRQVINLGESATLRWESINAERLSIEPGIGDVESTGSVSVRPEQTTTYELTVSRGDQSTIIPLTITVRPLATVSIQANITEGVSPLTVRFTPILDSTTAINRVYWDFEGDGGPVDGGLGVGVQGYDFLPTLGLFDATGRDVTFTFDNSGTYTTRVRVWDVDGNQSDGQYSIAVNNAAPVVDGARAIPTFGTSPLFVQFGVVATDGEGVESFEWDFDGDGTFDQTTRFGNGVSHTYDVAGTYQARVRITDVLGASIEVAPINLQIEVVTEPTGSVVVVASPISGQAPLTVNYFGSSFPINGEWEWDFDGDGSIDSTEGPSATHIYEKGGVYLPTVSYTDEDGNKGRDTLEIRVEDTINLAIVSNAIDPEDGSSATITLTSTGAGNVDVYIEDGTGEVVNTLATSALLSEAGATFTWAGTSDSGEILPPGDYYVIAETNNEGQFIRYDLRDTTAGLIFYPPAEDFGSCRVRDQGIVDCGSMTISDNPLEPFNNLPKDFDFTTPLNAKVTAYVTVQGNEIFAPTTFFRSRPLAASNYKLRWHADGTNGTILPSRPVNRGYVPAIYGLTAGDNSIFLTHETTLDNLSVEPPIFHPGLVPGQKGNQISFDLNRSADVQMIVDSVDAGVEVRRQTFANVPAGVGQVLQWDGRDDNGSLVAPGAYRISVTAQDEFDQESFTRRAMQRVRY